MATPADQYDSIFKAAGQEWNVDPLVLKALALHESNGNANAVGSSGEQGVMQIMPGTQQQLGVTKPFDPEQSIYGGAKYLAMALNAEGDNPAAALRYYNGGPGWRTSGGNPSYPSAVGAQYQKLAKADTGTLTDATPGPAPTAADAPDYNTPAAAPTKPTPAPADSKAPDAYDAALKPGGSGKAAAEPDPYTKALGTPAEEKPPEYLSPPGEDDAPAWTKQPLTDAGVGQAVRNALAPAPNTVYGDVVPLARDTTTGELRLAMPNMLRAPLIGLTEGPSGGATYNPQTGTFGVTPEAASVLPFVAGLGGRDIQFSGANALAREPGAPTFGKPPPVTLDELHAAMVRADAKAPPAPAPAAPEATPAAGGPQPGMGVAQPVDTGWRPVQPNEVFQPGRQFRMNQTTGLSEVYDPQPTAAGAQATPSSQATLTPEQAAEYGSTADKQWLYKSISPGEADNTEYIPGITPTMAQREQTVNAARAAKTDRNLSPEAAQQERETLDEHNTIRKDFFQDIAGSDVTQGAAVRDADQNISDGLKAAFSQGGKVDPQPIADAIQAERDAPSGKLPAVQSVMKTLDNALQKSDGSGMETDPQQVYGMRRVINFLQSKRGLAENPAYGDRDVQAALVRVKQATDAAIEPAAPGFTQAIADYAAAQRAIEANEALQAAEPKLYDQFGRMQFSKFHKFMGDVVKARDPNAPLNPYQSLTEDQMNRLKSLHDDLGRAASADDLAKAAGSDTAQNVLDAMKRAAQGVPGTLAAGAVGHVVGGPIGAVLGTGVKTGITNIFTRRAERQATQRMQNALHPDPTRYPTRPNPLLNPPQP